MFLDAWGQGDMAVLGHHPEPKNGLFRSRGGKGAGRMELASHRDVPRPHGRLAWLEFGVSQLGSEVHAASISLGSYSACTFESWRIGTYCGAWSLYLPPPRLPPAAKSPGPSRGDSHRNKPLPWRGEFVNNPAPFGVQQNQVASNPVLSSCGDFGGSAG